MDKTTEALRMALEALEDRASLMKWQKARDAVKEALTQPEQEPVAWEQFYPDIGKPQIEQPKVRTGDCLLVGVCASEGHKIQAKQEPWRESASDYERGVIDGRQMQAKSSVDKAVNRLTQPEQEPVAWREFIEQVAKQKPEKPDYWSSCSQCERNINDAEDLLEAIPPQRTERPVDCERCNRLEEQAYDLVGKLRVANIKLSMQPQRTFVGLTDKERDEICLGDESIARAIEAKLKEKNT